MKKTSICVNLYVFGEVPEWMIKQTALLFIRAKRGGERFGACLESFELSSDNTKYIGEVPERSNGAPC